METTKEAYEKIKNSVPQIELEDYNVVEMVEKHRNFWKPDNVRIVLLAESHVFTKKDEYAKEMQYPPLPELQNCPRNFVRLVYCLGYGEKSLINLSNNRGTFQFWKIFVSCTSNDERIQFDKILKSKTNDDALRLKNKIDVLNQLKAKGIWLLDASIVALYREGAKPSPKDMEQVMQICWDTHISRVIEKEKPKQLIIIGKAVGSALEDRLIRQSIKYAVLPQPNARLSGSKHNENYLEYKRLCEYNFESAH